MGNDKSCVWHAADFSDGELKEEMFCIRFGSVESECLSFSFVLVLSLKFLYQFCLIEIKSFSFLCFLISCLFSGLFIIPCGLKILFCVMIQIFIRRFFFPLNYMVV